MIIPNLSEKNLKKEASALNCNNEERHTLSSYEIKKAKEEYGRSKEVTYAKSDNSRTI